MNKYRSNDFRKTILITIHQKKQLFVHLKLLYMKGLLKTKRGKPKFKLLTFKYIYDRIDRTNNTKRE